MTYPHLFSGYDENDLDLDLFIREASPTGAHRLLLSRDI